MQETEWINPLKTSRRFSKRFAVADIESKSGDKASWTDFYMIGFYDGSKYRKFYILDKFLDYVFDNCHKIPIYFHYLDYDGMFLIDAFKEYEGTLVYPSFAGSLMLKIGAKQGDGEYEFRNSFTLLPYSLEALCDTFDEHPKVELSKLEERNYWDCVSTYNVMEKFISRMDRAVGLTTAQTALMNWRAKFLKYPVYNNKSLDALVYKTYHGGRVEVFNFNFDPDMKAYLYDINSMYPYVMKNNAYPVGQMHRVKKHEEGNVGICLVSFEDYGYFPAIPERIEKKTIYRNHKKFKWITTPEYEYLKELGKHCKYYFGFEASKVDHVFSDYVDHYFKMKSEAKAKGDKVSTNIAKLMLNSLYGKFGQKPMRREYTMNPDEEYLRKYRGEFTSMLPDMSVVYREYYRRSNFINPVWSALVTAHAGILLHQYASKCEPEIVLYGDTDSLYLKEKKLENSKRLGRMELEKVARPFYPISPKFYIAEDSVKMKGIPQERITKKDDEDTKMKKILDNKLTFVQLLLGKEIKQARGIKKFKSSLRAKEKKFVQLKILKKSMKSTYDKRLMYGIHTKPWVNFHPSQNNREFERVKNRVISNVRQEIEEQS